MSDRMQSIVENIIQLRAERDRLIDRVSQIDAHELEAHVTQGNTSGSYWIDFLTFWNVTLPLWWADTWPRWVLPLLMIASTSFIVWMLSQMFRLDWVSVLAVLGVAL